MSLKVHTERRLKNHLLGDIMPSNLTELNSYQAFIAIGPYGDDEEIPEDDTSFSASPERFTEEPTPVEHRQGGAIPPMPSNSEAAALKVSVKKALSENVETDYVGNEPLFRLAQYFRGIVNPKKVSSECLEPFVEQFYDHHEGLQACYDFQDVMLLFEDIWDKDKVKHPKRDTLGIAVENAIRQTAIRPESQWKMSPKLHLVDNVCYELQKIQDKEPFHLSQYGAAQIAGVSDKMGRCYLDKLERMGNIKRITTGSVANRLANTYFYTSLVSPPKVLVNDEALLSDDSPLCERTLSSTYIEST